MMAVAADWIYTASTWILPLLFAITFHEAAHGFAALRFGDDTAQKLGRVSANPLRHIDPFGTVALPALLLVIQAPFLFGWAKPVPVNFWRLHPARAGMVLVAAAGPATNLLLALISAFLLHAGLALGDEAGNWVVRNLANSIQINLILAVFNMIPLPPLDGGRVAVGLLPRALAMPLARLENKGMLILIGVIFLLPLVGSQLGYDLNVFAWIILPPVEFLGTLVLNMAGF